jgi:hypothetical protein
VAEPSIRREDPAETGGSFPRRGNNPFPASRVPSYRSSAPFPSLILLLRVCILDTRTYVPSKAFVTPYPLYIYGGVCSAAVHRPRLCWSIWVFPCVGFSALPPAGRFTLRDRGQPEPLVFFLPLLIPKGISEATFSPPTRGLYAGI